MPVETQTALIEALTRGDDEALLGTPESEWLDFKSGPYDLDTPKGKRDLVSDVAAFANHRGGMLVIGVKTVKRDDLKVEVAERVQPVRTALLDGDRMRAIIRAHVHPLLQVDIRRYERGATSSLLAIVIDSQLDREKPFMVDLVAAEDDDRTVPHAIGWPVRHGADTYWTPSARIQQLVSQGLRAETLLEAEAVSTVEEDLRMHVDMLDALEEWRSWAVITIQAIPHGAHDIGDFYGEFAGSVARWDDTRESGFGLHLRYTPLVRLSATLVAQSDEQFVAISRSGAVTVAAVGSPEFLGWATQKHTLAESVVVANPYAMVEFATEGVRLVHDLVGPATRVATWTFRVAAKRLTAPTPLQLRAHPARIGRRPIGPTTPQFERTVASTGDVWRDAFAVVAEIYGSGYGLGHENVPFAQDGRIDLGLMER